MDIKMPVMDGYEATEEIKKLNPEVVVIAQTAYAMKTDKEKVMKSGFDGYLSKPIKRDRLVSLIEKYRKKLK
jgi:CheY-like chemotaxis protein